MTENGDKLIILKSFRLHSKLENATYAEINVTLNLAITSSSPVIPYSYYFTYSYTFISMFLPCTLFNQIVIV